MFYMLRFHVSQDISDYYVSGYRKGLCFLQAHREDNLKTSRTLDIADAPVDCILIVLAYRIDSRGAMKRLRYNDIISKVEDLLGSNY